MITSSNKKSFSARVSMYIDSMGLDKIATVTVAKLAHELDMSLSSFYLHFEKEYWRNGTPGEFILFSKIFIAKNAMKKNPDISIPELAKKLGFKDNEYFVRLFTAREGLTPETLLQEFRLEREQQREKVRARKAKSRQRQKALGANQ